MSLMSPRVLSNILDASASNGVGGGGGGCGGGGVVAGGWLGW